MRKFYITFITATAFITVIPAVIGQSRITPTKTPTPIPTKSAQSNQIDQFKEKLASQVAQLTKKNQKVVAGIVESIAKNTAKVKTEEDGTFEVKIDPDITKYFVISGTSKSEKDTDDLKKGAFIIVDGPQVDKVVDANSIYEDEQLVSDSGKIAEISTGDNTISVVTLQKETFTLDIERTTKQSMLDIKTLEVETRTLAKIKEGDSIHFSYTKPDSDKTTRFSVTRVFVIPQEYFIK